MSENEKPKQEKPKRVNKIYNNSYKEGTKLKGDEYKMSKSLSADHDYSDSYLKDIYNPVENIDIQNMRKEILELIDNHEKLKEVFDESKKAKKFNKKNINFIFKEIYSHFTSHKDKIIFLNIIHLFDIISNITGLKSKNLFDLLDVEYKALILEELDLSFDVLDSYNGFKNKKMY
jgi:hypothetical protein